MAHTESTGVPRQRPPMSQAQRDKLSVAQRAYVAHDPRWPEHRRKLAAAQEAKRMTLFDNRSSARNRAPGAPADRPGRGWCRTRAP
jgi:hypothetical protein